MKSVVVPSALLALLVFGVIAYAGNKNQDARNANPLAGKVIIINPNSISKPRANARIETLAGKAYIVCELKPEDGNAYDSWIAIDEVSRLRVFENTEDTNAYLDRQKNN